MQKGIILELDCLPLVACSLQQQSGLFQASLCNRLSFPSSSIFPFRWAEITLEVYIGLNSLFETANSPWLGSTQPPEPTKLVCTPAFTAILQGILLCHSFHFSFEESQQPHPPKPLTGLQRAVVLFCTHPQTQTLN